MATINATIVGLERIEQRLRQMNFKGKVKAGILEGAVSQNVGRSSHLGGSNVLDYAPIQEFGGTIRVTEPMRGYLGAVLGIHLKASTAVIVIPSRPFLRQTFAEQHQTWVINLARAIQAGRTPLEALELVGGRMQEDIIAKIKSSMPPPNSAATQMVKEKYAPGAEGTLQFTGTLLHSIKYEVVNE